MDTARDGNAGIRRLRRVDWALAVLVVLVSVLHLAQFRGSLDARGIADEGYLLDAVQKINSGELIYKDFHIFQTPLSYFLLDLIFSVFGMTLGVARVFTSFLGGFMAFLTYVLSRALISHPLQALLPPLLFIFFGFHNWNTMSYHWIGMSLDLFGLFLLQRNIQNPAVTRHILIAGLLGGLSFLTIQTDGAIFLASAAVYLLLRARSCRKTGAPVNPVRKLTAGFRHRVRTRVLSPQQAAGLLSNGVKDVFLLGSGAMIGMCAFPILFFLYARTLGSYTSFLSLMKDFGYDCFVWTSGPYARANALPQFYYFGNQMIVQYLHTMISPASVMEFFVSSFGVLLVTLFGYAPFPALICSVWTLFLRRNRFGHYDQTMLLYSLTCFMFLMGAIMTRPDPLRLMLLSPISFVLFFAHLERVLSSPPGPPLLQRGIKWGFILLLLALGSAPIVWGVSWAYSNSHDPRYEVRLPRGTVVFHDRLKAAEFSSLAKFVNTHTKEGEYLYIHGYSPQYYFLFNRRNPTPYNLMLPVLFTPAQLRDAVSHLETRKPKYVLYDGMVEAFMKDPSKGTFPAITADEVQDNPMVKYVHSHYHPIMKFPSLGLSILEKGPP